MGPGPRPQRVRMPYVERLFEELSARDWSIITSLDIVRVATGLQLERLHFNELAGRSRSVMRWRVLKRLTDSSVLATLDRGSAGLCYVLDSAGQRLVRLRANREAPEARPRRPRPPGERFLAHALAVTELYVELVEHARGGQFRFDAFQAEADAYWPNGLGGWLKPDAFVKLHRGGTTDFWWYEAEIADKSEAAIRAKLLAYLDFARRGQLGPDDVVPRVMIGVTAEKPKRQAFIQAVIDDLPEPASALFFVALMPDVARIMVEELSK